MYYVDRRLILSEWGDTEGLCGGLSKQAAEDRGATPQTEGSGGGEAQSVSVLGVRGNYSPQLQASKRPHPPIDDWLIMLWIFFFLFAALKRGKLSSLGGRGANWVIW